MEASPDFLKPYLESSCCRRVAVIPCATLPVYTDVRVAETKKALKAVWSSLMFLPTPAVFSAISKLRTLKLGPHEVSVNCQLDQI